MPGTPINHTTLVAGATIDAATLNTNFENVNTYLNGTGLENQYIENALHNVVFTWHMDEVAVGTEQIGFKIPTSFSAAGGTFLELQAFVSEVNAAGTVDVSLHDDSVYPPTDVSRLHASNIQVDADGELLTETTFTTATFVTGDTFYIRYIVGANTVNGVTISLYAKADNRS